VLIDWVFLFGKDRCCLHDLIAGTSVASVAPALPVAPEAKTEPKSAD